MSDTTTSGGTGAPAPRVLGGRYEVGSLLGRGGMAEVHVARDTRLGRMVAVKLLRSDLARDPSFQARFRREAQAAAGLNHPAIVAVYDTGADHAVESGGSKVDLPWIVMEYVEGRTLRDMMRKDHPLSLEEAMKFTEGVLNALEYSHRMGIVHRDIKPANVMITPAGEVKVMDFGIARAISDSSATLTATSAVMGTAQYLSPEQARGEQVDARSDLYSAGCLLFEIITGRPPFVGDAPVAVAYQHVSEQPRPPSEFAPQIPPAVDHVVLMALSKDREHRYQSAGDFADDLRRAVEGRPLRGASFAPPPVTPDATQAFSAAGPATAATTLTPPVRGGYPAMPTGASPTGALPPVADDDVPPEEERRRRWPWALLVVVLVLGVGGAGIALTNRDATEPDPAPVTTSAPVEVDVPDLVGSTREEAQTLLEDSQLEGNFVDVPDDDVAEGSVVSSNPASGQSVAVGQVVTVNVSTGPSAVTVPNLSGLSQDDARAELVDAGLGLGNVTRTDDDPGADPDTVVSWDSQGASVSPGTLIAVQLASGQVVVPDVTGLSVDEAQSRLNALRLTVNTGEAPADADGEPGTIATQSLTATSRVNVGAAIDLTVVQETEETPTESPSPTASPTTSGGSGGGEPSDSAAGEPTGGGEDE